MKATMSSFTVWRSSCMNPSSYSQVGGPKACRCELRNSGCKLKSFQMILSKEYVGYLAREMTKKLVQNEFIETSDLKAATERVNAAMQDEMAVEDRINDEVRVILQAYSEEMRKSGASYQEMFKKVKNELVRKYKAVL